MPRHLLDHPGGWQSGENAVVDRQYFTRQAVTLLKFAKTTRDPNVAAGLVEKAVDLRAQVDDARAPFDRSPRAPDVQSES